MSKENPKKKSKETLFPRYYWVITAVDDYIDPVITDNEKDAELEAWAIAEAATEGMGKEAAITYIEENIDVAKWEVGLKGATRC